MEESEGEERSLVLKSLESKFKALQHMLTSKRSMDECSADDAWSGWLKCQGLIQIPDGGVVEEQPGSVREQDDMSVEAASRRFSKEDLVFARTKRRTFFPGIKVACPGQSDRVKVKMKCSSA